jgi:hypothetical protein
MAEKSLRSIQLRTIRNSTTLFVLARKAGEEGDPLRSNGVGEGTLPAKCPHLSHPALQDGPLSSPASQEKTLTS